MKDYFRKPYMTQGISKHSDYMKAIPQKAIDVQGQIAPNIEFKKPYDYQPNTAQMIHYYSNQLHYLGGDPVPPLNDPSLLPHAPVLEIPITMETKTIELYPVAFTDDCCWAVDESGFYDTTYGSYLGIIIFVAKSGRQYIRFPSVSIPVGSVIKSAVVRFYSNTNSAVPCITKVYCNNTASSVAPTTAAGGNALAITNAYVDYNVGSWASSTFYNSPEIKTVVQEIIDRRDWREGNSLGFLFYDNGSSSGRGFQSVLGANKPKLTIRYEYAI
jgi:hypothetical protein